MGIAGRTTRGQFLAGAGALAAPVLLGARRAGAATIRRRPRLRGSLVATSAELAQVHANVFEHDLVFARRAWDNTLEQANDWLGYSPSPPRDDEPVDDWYEQLYKPGLHDGNAAYTLGLAYALGGRKEHAHRAREICLAWARSYRHSRPQSEIGHMVAEPVGPVIKLCLAFQLTRAVFSAREDAEFRAWAAQFVDKGRHNADRALDDPWVMDVVYGQDRTNVGPYGNSATWQRAMAVWAAATVGGRTLRSTLDWNFAHRTPHGKPYGWDELLEGMIIDGARGQLAEDRYRSSLEYGMFSYAPLVLIADLARRTGFRPNLFTYASRQHGYTLLTPIPYYGHFITRDTVDRSLEQTDYADDWTKTAGRWRAFLEVIYRNVSDAAAAKTLARIVSYHGPKQRGDNYDIYITNYAALLGRGPDGPLPEDAARPRRRRPKP